VWKHQSMCIKIKTPFPLIKYQTLDKYGRAGVQPHVRKYRRKAPYTNRIEYCVSHLTILVWSENKFSISVWKPSYIPSS
jgi:hypothetical protein